MEDIFYQVVNEDLRKSDLKHYEKLSMKCHCQLKSIPEAINFHYDYRGMSFWEKIKLAFKKLY